MDGKLDVSKLFASVAELKGLENLILKGFRFRSMPCLDDLGILDSVTMLKIEGLLPRLPNSFPPKIYYLDLVNSRVNEDPMPVLEELPELTHLKLRNAYTGKKMVILQHGFPKLEVLCIKELRNLRDVRVGEGAMPELRILEIKNCPRLETLPEEIGSMTDLRYFKMVTTKNIAAKIRNSSLISDIDKVEINP